MILNRSADKIATQRALINTIRDELEVAPVTITVTKGTYLIDCHEKADIRMANALLLWSSLGVTTLPWTMADNSVVDITETDLQEIQTAVIAARGLRSLQLHGYATGLKATLPVADDSTIFDKTTWVI